MAKNKKKLLFSILLILIVILTINTSQAAQDFNSLNTTIQSADPGVTIDLNDNYTDNSADGIQITITKDIIINGNGNVLNFNKKTANNIIINNGVTVTLKNLTLINGNNSHGGVINNNGTLIIINSKFINNTANGTEGLDYVGGGAIYNWANLNITSSKFINNNAWDGGAIYNWANLNITSSEFSNNNVLYDGGAIYNWMGNITITGSKFISNNASNDSISDGGAIFNNKGNITITNSNFTNNTAANTAGTIYNNGNITITNSNFTNNTATPDGGSIYNKGNINISNSNFNSNTAITGSGGAIYNDGKLNITTSNFTSNIANYGGVIYNHATLIIRDSSFTGNYGSVIFNHNGNLNVFASNFTSNTASYGGVIYNQQAEATIDDSSFINNHASLNGGVIYNCFSSELSISHSVISNNTGNYYMYNTGSSRLNANGNYWGNLNPTTDNLVFNFTVTNYYLFKLTSNKNNMSRNEIANLSVICVSNDTNTPWSAPEIDIGNITFNTTPTSATITQTSKVTATFQPHTLDTYTVTAKSTLIPELSTEIIIKRSSFEELNQEIQNNLTAHNNEMNLTRDYKDLNNVPIIINGSIIINGNGHLLDFNNQVSVDASRITIINGVTVTLNDLIVINGYAGYGPITNNGNLSLNNILFENNTVFSCGGAILNEVGGIINISNSSFINNAAGDGMHNRYGGAIFNMGNITIVNSSFINNTAVDYGGAIYNNALGTLTISQSILIGGTDIIYNKGNINADGNYWGNLNPTIDSLVNFAVDDYYLFKINSDKSSTRRGELVNLNAGIVLNTTNSSTWMGPTIDMGTVTFNNIANANITQTGNYTATFTSSTLGTYTVTADTTHLSTLSITIRVRLANFEELNNEIQNNLTAHNTEMNLTQDYADNTGFQIIINRSILINGNGHVLDFNKQTDNYIIINWAKVTLNKLTLVNGNNTDGGTIYNNGTLIINNCLFENNTATMWGGAIYNDVLSNFTINGSTFNNNTAREGGAIWNYNGIFNIINSIFTNNQVTLGGGAITNDGALSISNSTFTDNIASGNNSYGGAIVNAGMLSLSNSTFTDNIASGNNSYGGAIYSRFYLDINNSTFTANNASGNNTYGGAIFADGGITIIDSSFINNTSPGSNSYGGAIYNDNGRLNITDSTFTSNSAIYGGVIENYRGTFNITDSTFTSNTAEYGGAIDNYLGTLNIINNTFMDNTALEGGAISNDNGTLIINDSSFTGNSAFGYGGAIENSANITIIDSSFTSNTAEYGGAIDNYENSLVIIRNSSFTDNIAKFGGSIYADNGTINITGSKFMDNNATENGGVIYSNDTSTLNILNSSFTGNTATSYGGVIVNNGDIVSIMGSNFNNNTAGYGGAITNFVNITISDSNFINNNATGFGGSIHNMGSMNISSSKFMDNNAMYGGGAINNPGYSNIISSTFNNNTALEGGAIYTVRNITITGSTFTGNNATLNGGVIYNDVGILNISQSILADNMGNYTIYSTIKTINTANGNYWGNLNPTVDNLTNFLVEDYYRLSLGNDTSTFVGTKITISLLPRLNTTEETTWTGPVLIIPNATFNCTPDTVDLKQTNNNTVIFTAPASGVYNVIATTLNANSRITVTVNKLATNIVITSMTSSLKQGNTFKIVVTLKTGTTPLTGKIVTFKGYRGKTYTNKTNSKGQATLYIKKVVAGTYTITAQYQGDTTQYNLSNKVSRKLTVAKPVTILKITSTTPRNGQKGYSQTRTFIITFNQKIKKSSKYSKIYIRNLNTRLYVTFTKKIVGNKLYIKMKAKRYKKHYYRIYIPRYAIVSYNKKTITKSKTIKFRT